MHIPERWGIIQFSADPINTTTYIPDPYLYISFSFQLFCFLFLYCIYIYILMSSLILDHTLDPTFSASTSILC